MKLQLATYTVC